MNLQNILMKIGRKNPFRKLFYSTFGKNSLIYKPLCVNKKKYINIGDNVTIKEGARIETITRWNNKIFSPSLVIGDNTSFEQSLHLICTSNIIIGNNNLFSARIFITTCNHSYENINTPVIKQDLISSNVIIGNNCFIGMDVKIFPGVTIGDNVIIGANTIVNRDLPSYTVCVGTPAKPIKKFDFNLNKWVKYEEDNSKIL